MRRLAPDVVHANLTSMRSCRAAIFAALTLRVPVVLVDHLPLPSLRARGRLLQRLLTRLAAARLSVGFKSSRLVEQIVGTPTWVGADHPQRRAGICDATAPTGTWSTAQSQ
jgi:hypothetical protein